MIFSFANIAFSAPTAALPPTEPLPIYHPLSAAGHGNFNTTWPGFPGKWKARQAAFARDAARQKGAIVFLGDSITEECPLAKLFPGKLVANRGISGDTSRGMLTRADHNVAALAPTGVVLLCGANDMLQPGYTAQATAGNIAAIVSTIREKHPQTKIAVLETLPNQKAAKIGVDVTALNKAMDAELAKFPGILRIKTYHPFMQPDGEQNPALFRDGVHLTAAGYEVYRTIMDPVLTTMAAR